jgi:hypothetical protein
LGFAFGVAVLLSGDAAAFLAVDPIATVAVVLIKGAACGFAAGLLYQLIGEYNRVIAVFSAAIICPIVNTGVFLIGCYLFFLETVSGWGAALGFSNATEYMFLGLAGTNFLIELAVNIVLAPVIVRLIKINKLLCSYRIFKLVKNIKPQIVIQWFICDLLHYMCFI